MDAIKELLSRLEPQGNRTVPGPPKLGVAILTCMDTRIDPARMFGLQPGDAHVLRNAGGVVTDDVLRSLLLSQRFLGSRAVMVIHHTKCGVLGLSDDQVKAELQAEVGFRPSFALEGFTDLEADVRQSMARIRHCPFLPHRDNIRGFILDVDDGDLREVL
ncbi:MAG: carbonic anhydrase [Actinomycetota bacterium]